MKIKLFVLYILSFSVSVLPVLIYFFSNADRYFIKEQDKVRLCCGLLLLTAIIFLKVIGKLKMPSRVAFFSTVFILCYLLESVLGDILVFTFLALVGEIMDSICQIFIRRTREKILVMKTAQATAYEIKRSLSGRV